MSRVILEADFLPRGEASTFEGSPTFLLRFASGADRLAQWDGTGWTPLETTVL